MEKVVLTTGIYDLIKDHVRRKKVTNEQEVLLNEKLRNASQVLRKDLPEDVVAVNKKLVINDLSIGEKKELYLVGPKKTRISNNKISVLSDVGLATLGHKVGEVITWPTSEGEKKYEIIDVAEMSS